MLHPHRVQTTTGEIDRRSFTQATALLPWCLYMPARTGEPEEMCPPIFLCLSLGTGPVGFPYEHFEFTLREFPLLVGTSVVL